MTTIPTPHTCRHCHQPITLNTDRSRRANRWASLRINPFTCLASSSLVHAPVGVA